MTLDELISQLQALRNETGEDIPVRLVFGKMTAQVRLGEQHELIDAQIHEGWDSPVMLLFAGRLAAQMDWPGLPSD